MSARNISWGKGKPHGILYACTGIALPLPLPFTQEYIIVIYILILSCSGEKGCKGIWMENLQLGGELTVFLLYL